MSWLEPGSDEEWGIEFVQRLTAGFINPTVETAVPSDAVLDEAVRDEVKGWSRERQLEVYKWLNLEAGVRMGASLDYELTELRRKRREACR